MKKFTDFNIQVASKSFTGDKIKISKILNKEITIHEFKIENSKFHGECLYLQIEHKNERCVIFTGSTTLINQIRQVPQEGFPFQTTIIEQDERYLFT